MPAVAVFGVGAVVAAVPPVPVVYQFRLVPVALNAVADAVLNDPTQVPSVPQLP